MFRRRADVATAALALLLAACSGTGTATGEGGFVGRVVDNPAPKPAFTLLDTEGRPFDFAAETEGRLTLLYFGYTHCPDICPVHLAQLTEIFREHPDLGRQTTVVFVTVDPERDTPAVVGDFLDSFDPDFVGLTGSVEEVAAAQTAAGVAVAGKVGEGDDYTMAHAGQVIAYAPDGLNYTQYPFGTRQEDWLHDLPILLERTERTPTS